MKTGKYILCVVAAICFSCSSRNNSETHYIEFTIQGNDIQEINAKFIGTYDKASTRLSGQLRLRNEANVIVNFPLFQAFAVHVQVHESSSRALFRRGGAIDPKVESLPIGPNQTLDRRFDFFLRDYFDLPKGPLRIDFVYDSRLIGGKNPFVPWGKEPIEVR